MLNTKNQNETRQDVRRSSGFSIAEVMVVMVVVSVAIVGVFGLVMNGLRLTTLTENRITALNLAREGIEAATNIRDTNWLKYANDKDLCWMTADYDGACIANQGTFYTSGSYTLFRRFTVPDASGNPLWFEYDFDRRLPLIEHPTDNPPHNQWILQRVSQNLEIDGDIMRDPYTVMFDNRGLPFQTASSFDELPTELCVSGKKASDGSLIDRTANCRSIFHRTIILEFANDLENFGIAECFDYDSRLARCVHIRSIIQWNDSTRRSAEPYTMEIDKVITNWSDGF